MKAHRTRWIMVLTGIVAVIITASMGTIHAQQFHEGSQLKQDITLAGQKIDKVQVDELVKKKELLEKQLAQTKADFENIRAGLSVPAQTISAVYTLFDIVTRAGVQIDEINSSASSGEDLAGLSCSVLSLTMRIHGEMDNIIECLLILNQGLTNGVVRSANIDESQDGETPSAIIKLSIYSYQGN